MGSFPIHIGCCHEITHSFASPNRNTSEPKRLFRRHLLFGLEYLCSLCDFRGNHYKAKTFDGHRLHLYFSVNFRLKLLRVEFSSKQPLRISLHHLPFTDPRNHTVCVLWNQLTVAQTADGVWAVLRSGLRAARTLCTVTPNEKQTIVSRRERHMLSNCLARTEIIIFQPCKALGLKLFFPLRVINQMLGVWTTPLCSPLSLPRENGFANAAQCAQN